MNRLPLSRQFVVLSALVALAVMARTVVGILFFGERDHMIYFLSTGMGLAGLILLMAPLYFRYTRAKLDKVLQAMKAVEEGGYPKLVVINDDIIGQLTKGFNEMVESLRQRDEKVQTLTDQAESKLSELSSSLEAEREKLGTVLDSIGDGVLVFDGEGKVVMANWRVAGVFGMPMEALLQSDLRSLVDQIKHRLLYPDQVEERLHELQQDPEAVGELTLELDQPGTPVLRLYSAPVRGIDGKVLGRVATSLDIGKDRELERLKTEFISTISHELRTPLTSIKGALGLIRGGAAGGVSADMRELLEIAMTNTDRLVHVINNILDVVQLERGQGRMHPIPMILASSIRRAVTTANVEAQRRRIMIEVDVPDNLPAVKADAARIEQVLLNLLSNAVKFSPKDGRVIISARQEGEMVHISVQDFGRGMSAEFIRRLFSKFEHAQGALTRESQGAGLGLAICKHLVEAHGGKIWVNSLEGAGSTFHFTLPTIAIVPAEQESKPLPENSRAGGKLVLVIEDDPDAARIIAYVFESLGHKVIAVHSGNEAIEVARRHHPDLLTLDLGLPDMDGFVVLRTLRKSGETTNTPIICISAEPDSGTALADGADYYLEKPISLDRVREVASFALAKVAKAGGVQ
jgi:signal transduction histidine kinase/ActR/RegA family two-component response regulator